MADDIDRAADLTELFLQTALSHVGKANPKLPCVSVCHNCRDTVATDAQFCDADCRDDWTKRNRL